MGIPHVRQNIVLNACPLITIYGWTYAVLFPAIGTGNRVHRGLVCEIVGGLANVSWAFQTFRIAVTYYVHFLQSDTVKCLSELQHQLDNTRPALITFLSPHLYHAASCHKTVVGQYFWQSFVCHPFIEKIVFEHKCWRIYLWTYSQAFNADYNLKYEWQYVDWLVAIHMSDHHSETDELLSIFRISLKNNLMYKSLKMNFSCRNKLWWVATKVEQLHAHRCSSQNKFKV